MIQRKNILYYSPSVPAADSLLFMPTAPLYLNSYLNVYHNELANIICWKKFQFFHLTQQELVDTIQKLDIDILCITLYIWNHRQILEQIKNIKATLSKEIKIIVGGPSTEIIRNKEFLNQHQDIDFAVYSQGERAFADILDHIFGKKKLSLLTSKNVAWRKNNKTKIADFEFIRLEKINPYMNSQELIKTIVKDVDYKDWKFVLPYETSRGCPYNCSFCDWTSGLTHKTYLRKFNIEEELEFLAKNNITNFHLSDANFGQTIQDLQIAKTWAKLKQTKGYNFKIHNTNFAKLQKERVFEIVNILLANDIFNNLKFAVQDTHEDILANINRPDIPWADHKLYLDEVKENYPSIEFGIELIQGLPGQTRETWENNFIRIDPYKPIIYPWAILPNSPAGYDNEYRNRMKIKYIKSNFPFINEINADDNIQAETVVETFSYNTKDYAYFSLISQIFTDAKFHKLFLNKKRSEIIEMVKNNDNLDITLDIIEKSIFDSNHNDLRTAYTVFIKQIIKDNLSAFDKQAIKNIISGDQ